MRGYGVSLVLGIPVTIIHSDLKRLPTIGRGRRDRESTIDFSNIKNISSIEGPTSPERLGVNMYMIIYRLRPDQ